MGKWTGRSVVRVAALAGALMVPHSLSADLEDDLEQAWVGAWVVTKVETASDCSGTYTNVEVRGLRSTSRGSRRFGEGELARIDKLNQKSDRVDLYLSVAEPILVPRTDGPFTLYDQRSCRVQLMVDVPKAVLKSGRLAEVEAALLESVERHETEASARRSEAWNRRERDPYPRDYEETLARHAAWKAEEVNRALAATRLAALDEAAQALSRVTDDPDYLAGFAAGVEAQRRRSAPGCSSLAGAGFSGEEERAPGDRRGSSPAERSFQRGFRDGQVVAWATRVARAVEGCFVPVPGY